MLSTSFAEVPGTAVAECDVPKCKTKLYWPLRRARSGYRNKNFFKAPKELERRIQWLEILKIPFTDKEIKICQDHFGDNAYTDSLCRRLLKFAKPNPFNPPPESSDVRDEMLQHGPEDIQVITISDDEQEKDDATAKSTNTDVESLLRSILERPAVKVVEPDSFTLTVVQPDKNLMVEFNLGKEMLRKKIAEVKNRKETIKKMEKKKWIPRKQTEEFELPSGRKVIFETTFMRLTHVGKKESYLRGFT